MPGNLLYQKPIRRTSISYIRANLNPTEVISSIQKKIGRSQSVPADLQALSTPAKYANEPSEIINPTNEHIIPGMYPPHIEAMILSKMKTIAIAKSTQEMWLDSYRIFNTILDCQKVTLGCNHYKVANTLYYIGTTLNKLDNSDAALLEFERGVQILYPSRHQYKNMDLALLLYEIGIIFGTRINFDKALYYLDLSRQTEVYINGIPSEKTCHMIMVYGYKKSSGADQSSRRL